MEAKNTGDKPFELTAALHTYIAVSAIDKVRCAGPKCIFLLLKCLLRQSVFKRKARVKPILLAVRHAAVSVKCAFILKAPVSG